MCTTNKAWEAEYIFPVNKPPHIEFMTNHMQKRTKRLEVAQSLIKKEKAVLLKTFQVQRKDRLPELHHIYTNGVIEVTDVDSKLLITVLIGREDQIKRYYVNQEESCPWITKAYCQQHEKLGYSQL